MTQDYEIIRTALQAYAWQVRAHRDNHLRPRLEDAVENGSLWDIDRLTEDIYRNKLEQQRAENALAAMKIQEAKGSRI